MRRILSHPATMIGSDGLPNDPRPHPRLWGTFPRVLGHYSREEGLFSLAEAVRKMTGMPAQRFGLAGRGLIKRGFAADLVLFDPETIIDTATFSEPIRAGQQASRPYGSTAFSPILPMAPRETAEAAFYHVHRPPGSSNTNLHNRNARSELDEHQTLRSRRRKGRGRPASSFCYAPSKPLAGSMCRARFR